MAAEWLNQIPEDLRAEPSLQNIPDIPTLAKNYKHAQQLIGQNRIPAPDKNWGDAQWNEFYAKIGRPEKHTEYKLPENVKLAEGLAIDDKRRDSAFEAFHKAGLTPKQAEAVMGYYMETMNTAYTQEEENRKQTYAAGVEELKRQHGAQYEAVVQIADQVLRQLGDEKFVNYLKESGLANHPQMVNFLHKIGTSVMEDRQRGSGTGSPFTGNAGQAKMELDRLEGDTEFQKIYRDRKHPQHQAAIDRVLNLNRILYPGKAS